jgi:hypothetical protein
MMPSEVEEQEETMQEFAPPMQIPIPGIDAADLPSLPMAEKAEEKSVKQKEELLRKHFSKEKHDAATKKKAADQNDDVAGEEIEGKNAKVLAATADTEAAGREEQGMAEPSLASKRNFTDLGQELYGSDDYQNCNPRCIPGRGICNDNVCFCKTPFTGTRCQHSLYDTAYRFSFTMLVASAVASTLFGVVLAYFIYGFIRESLEKRMALLGEPQVQKECWMPSDRGSKKRTRHGTA